MSKGLGVLQRAVLALMEEHPNAMLRFNQIGGGIYGARIITRAEYEALRRAVRGLIARKLITEVQWWKQSLEPEKPVPYALAACADEMFSKFVAYMARKEEEQARLSVVATENATLKPQLSVVTDTDATLKAA